MRAAEPVGFGGVEATGGGVLVGAGAMAAAAELEPGGAGLRPVPRGAVRGVGAGEASAVAACASFSLGSGAAAGVGSASTAVGFSVAVAVAAELVSGATGMVAPVAVNPPVPVAAGVLPRANAKNAAAARSDAPPRANTTLGTPLRSG